MKNCHSNDSLDILVALDILIALETPRVVRLVMTVVPWIHSREVGRGRMRWISHDFFRLLLVVDPEYG